MNKERIVWIVALFIAAGIAFFGGQQLGVGQGRQERAQAAQAFFANRGNGSGAPNAGRGVTGTVSAINGTTITLSERNGTTASVELAAGGVVRKQVDGQLSDIKVGDRIVAIGQQSGNVIQAQTIQVGGFGGPTAAGTGQTQP